MRWREGWDGYEHELCSCCCFEQPEMRILLVNWQDRDNPQAGGAEIHMHEIFGRLAARGHEVTLLCGGWPRPPQLAELDGITVPRRGTRYTVPGPARRYFNRPLRSYPCDCLRAD